MKLALATLALCALALPGEAQTRRALIIGINDYVEAGAGDGTRSFGDLRGAVNDAQAFREVLIARYGFARDEIEMVLDAAATRDGIIASIRRLIERSGAADLAVLYYAGHGSQIYNSKSENDLDQLDQTLVPHDAGAGARDIWDKELKSLLNDLVDTGALVTAFFDSCHSGSVTRGLPRTENARWVRKDDRDAAELYADVPPDDRPAPSARGALIFSAARDHQTAKETGEDEGGYHGIFSHAVLRVLRTVPVDEPASRIFKRTRAIMQADGCTQEPVLEGTGGDRDLLGTGDRPLFGAATDGASGRIAIGIQSVTENGVFLQGGRALGLGAGTELVSAKDASTRLRIEEVLDLTSSRASVVAGNGRAIDTGQLFEVDKWVPPAEAHLSVYVPPALDSFEELATAVRELGERENVHLVDDPTEDVAPTHVLRLDGSGWELVELLPDGDAVTALGETLDAAAVGALFPDELAVRLLVHLPPPSGLLEALAFSNVNADSAIVVRPTPADAHYVLLGRMSGSVPEYSWVLPGGIALTEERHLALPVRTDWVALPDEPSGRGSAVSRLRRQALRTGRVRAWLRLEGPPADRKFPWRLALRNENTGAILDGGTIPDVADEWFELVLTVDAMPRIRQKRYVYVFAIDCHGRSTLLFPGTGASASDNLFPPPGSGKDDTIIPLPGGRIQVQPPYGTDTIVLLTTKDEALQDPHALEWEPVLSDRDNRTRGAKKKGPLDRLLTSALGPTRSARVEAPTAWSISRMQIVTTAKE